MEQSAAEQLDHIKGVVESLLFVNERPITLDQIKKVFATVSGAEIKKAIKDLVQEYETRGSGVTIKEIAGGYQMLSNPVFAGYIRDFYKTKHKEKLSKPALETLAIIAYKQPVTRSDIESIRSVNSDGVVASLQSKELIKIVGHKDVAGKPFLYGTTKQFMEYFGLKSLDDLPKLEEFSKLEPEYEKAEYQSDPENAGIPQEAVPMNSLEKMKQSAIKEHRATETDPSITAEDQPSTSVATLEPEERDVFSETNEDKNES